MEVVLCRKCRHNPWQQKSTNN